MGVLKTLARVALLWGLSLWPGSLFADDMDDLQVFARCTGRLSAVMEDQWLFDGPASDRTKAMRDAMATLVTAVAGPDEVAEAMNWRVSAKAAQAALLAVARFGEPAAALRAQRQSDALVGACTGLLLG